MDEHKYFVGVCFVENGKKYYFSTDFDDLKIGDHVVVETVSGLEMGTICSELKEMKAYKSNLELKAIMRKATQDDYDDYAFNIEESKKALKITEKLVKQLELDMNLLDANYTLDGTKVTITYTADQRVDFRELLKMLAPLLHCRIELRQIAPRDKAKSIGGLGTCGLPLCCSTFLNQFDSISISRAKNQMLTLNIPKLSGACGKFMCCLLYEDDMYTEAKKNFPQLGTVVKLDDGDYTISGMNILNKQIKLNNGQMVRFMSLEEVQDILSGKKKAYKERITEEMPTIAAKEVPEQENRNQNNNNRRHFRGNRHKNDKGA